jgi:hypothetical protein
VGRRGDDELVLVALAPDVPIVGLNVACLRIDTLLLRTKKHIADSSTSAR